MSALLRLISLTILCELAQRPLILQSFDVNCDAPNLGYILLSSLLRLISFTLFM